MYFVSTLTRYNSTNINSIKTAIKAIKLSKASASFLYRKVAKQFNVNRTTLLRRHKSRTQFYAAALEKQQLLNLQQKAKLKAALVQYIKNFTKKALPFTKEIIQNFAS
ncbi:hypothetical protein BDV95DRAFT_501921 [Massariosphaeria phaeospora]|uniref:HTH psq-type domain-containing protein n=1 Tax=Massariosphaeria phaeospora TaxID=100035 RepID=A0A7C8M4U2_9PLEO|nr:hypothetical protein BDV95DRAFT_501921 [Massariosphaeria phaeospora]